MDQSSLQDSAVQKQELMNAMKNTKILSSIQAEMRAQIIQKLMKANDPKSAPPPEIPQTINRRLTASLINDFLSTNRFDYSKKVFEPESGYSESMLSRNELKSIIDKKKTNFIKNPQSSLLENLIDTFLDEPNVHQRYHAATQTETIDNLINLEQRLQNVDQTFKEKLNKINETNLSVDERMQRFKKEFMTRMEAEKQAELVRIREFELASIRIDEANKFQVQMQEYRNELETNYLQKLQKLREKEKEVGEKCQAKAKELESASHDHRHRLLRDLEMIQLREREVEKREKMLEDREVQQKGKLQEQEKHIHKRLQDHQLQAEQHERKLKNQENLIKLDALKEFENERLEVQEQKLRTNEDLMKLNQYREQIENYREQNVQLKKQIDQYQESIDQLKSKKKLAEQDGNTLRENMKAQTDSQRRDQLQLSSLQSQLQIKDEEIRILKESLKEKTDTLNLQKVNYVDQTRKFNFETKNYQDKIEELEKSNRNFRVNQEKSFDLKSRTYQSNTQRNFYQEGMTSQNHFYPNQNMSDQKQYFNVDIETLKKEQELLAEKRRKAIESLNSNFIDENVQESAKFQNFFNLDKENSHQGNREHLTPSKENQKANLIIDSFAELGEKSPAQQKGPLFSNKNEYRKNQSTAQEINQLSNLSFNDVNSHFDEKRHERKNLPKEIGNLGENDRKKLDQSEKVRQEKEKEEKLRRELEQKKEKDEQLRREREEQQKRDQLEAQKREEQRKEAQKREKELQDRQRKEKEQQDKLKREKDEQDRQRKEKEEHEKQKKEKEDHDKQKKQQLQPLKDYQDRKGHRDEPQTLPKVEPSGFGAKFKDKLNKVEPHFQNEIDDFAVRPSELLEFDNNQGFKHDPLHITKQDNPCSQKQDNFYSKKPDAFQFQKPDNFQQPKLDIKKDVYNYEDFKNKQPASKPVNDESAYQDDFEEIVEELDY